MLFIYLFFQIITDIQSGMRPMSECVNQFLQYLYIYSEVFVLMIFAVECFHVFIFKPGTLLKVIYMLPL